MDMSEKQNLLESVDARTRLAGSNQMEILLFSLGTKEIFGINVFKVREVGRTPHPDAEYAAWRRGPDLTTWQRDPRVVALELS
jgi:hypothetical protein